MAEFAKDSEFSETDKFTNQVQVGNVALLLLRLNDGPEKEKLSDDYKRLKDNTLPSVFSFVWKYWVLNLSFFLLSQFIKVLFDHS